MAIEQLPAAQFAVGGQSTVAKHVVGQTVDGFEEDGETKQTSGGQFKCDLTYSRRATKEITMECEDDATVTHYAIGGSVDASFVPCVAASGVWEIRNATITKTRGPIQVALSLVSLTEAITAP